jgi:hypothetical protein
MPVAKEPKSFFMALGRTNWLSRILSCIEYDGFPLSGFGILFGPRHCSVSLFFNLVYLSSCSSFYTIRIYLICCWLGVYRDIYIIYKTLTFANTLKTIILKYQWWENFEDRRTIVIVATGTDCYMPVIIYIWWFSSESRWAALATRFTTSLRLFSYFIGFLSANLKLNVNKLLLP